MKALRKKIVVGVAVTLFGLLGMVANGMAVSITLPTADQFNTGQNGDFFAYSFNILNYFYGTPIPSSTPGAIKDDLVLYTGASGGPLNNNNDPSIGGNVDNPFAAPSGAGTTKFDFSIETDPTPNWGPGDRSHTWDISLPSLKTFLTVDGQTLSPILLFQQNQENSGGATNQDIFGWGAVTLWNSQTGSYDTGLKFEFAGPTRTGASWNTPYTGNGICTGANCDPTNSASDPINFTHSNSAANGEFTFGAGQECLDAAGNQVACNSPLKVYPAGNGVFNNNLGANQFAYAFVSFKLNNELAACLANGPCPYDTLSVDLKLRNLTDGFEQLVIRAGSIDVVPEPATLLLLGLGLVGLAGVGMRRKFKR